MSIASLVFPLAVGPIKTITNGFEGDICLFFGKKCIYMIKVIKFCIYFKPFSYTDGKFNERPFKNNILKVLFFIFYIK